MMRQQVAANIIRPSVSGHPYQAIHAKAKLVDRVEVHQFCIPMLIISEAIALCLRLAKRSERSPDIFSEQFRLFPSGEVSAFQGPVVVKQIGISFLGPALRGLKDLVWKSADGNRDLDPSGIEKATLVFPIETSR